MRFLEKLKTISQKNQSLLCIGLDPQPSIMPVNDIFAFNKSIIDATSDLVCAYKPNLAFYEAQGINGLQALDKILAYIPNSIPVIGDSKRNDIDSSSKAYAQALFDTFNFDAVTVNPYMGYDSMAPFFEYTDKGIFILCKTSNAGALDFQELQVANPSAQYQTVPLFEIVASKAMDWNKNGNIGLVVGATYPEQLKRVRELCPDLPLLIPGIGTQRGDLKEAVKYGSGIKKATIIINCSRKILYASKHNDFAVSSRNEAIKIKETINNYLFE